MLVIWHVVLGHQLLSLVVWWRRNTCLVVLWQTDKKIWTGTRKALILKDSKWKKMLHYDQSSDLQNIMLRYYLTQIVYFTHICVCPPNQVFVEFNWQNLIVLYFLFYFSKLLICRTMWSELWINGLEFVFCFCWCAFDSLVHCQELGVVGVVDKVLSTTSSGFFLFLGIQLYGTW